MMKNMNYGLFNTRNRKVNVTVGPPLVLVSQCAENVAVLLQLCAENLAVLLQLCAENLAVLLQLCA
jgi:hypothetical protein